MWAVDTSWLVALFDEDDEHHAKAWKDAKEPGALLLNPVILIEFLEVARRRGGRAASLQALADVERMP